MRPTAELVQTIRTRGGKVTPQRLLLYDLLQGNTAHPSAEMLHDHMRNSMPTVSLTTVYKALNELVLMGDLKRFDVDGVAHFDPNTDIHAETVCRACGRIDDVELADTFGVDMLKGHAFRTSGVVVHGYCIGCASHDRGPNQRATLARRV